MGGERPVHPDCRNSSNPYHECCEYCFRVIVEAKKLAIQNQPENMGGERPVHPDCRNSSNPYHECSEYCFEIIIEAMKLAFQNQPVQKKKMSGERTVHPDCWNLSNSYHACNEYCLKNIAEAKKLAIRNQQVKKEKMDGERAVYPDCRNSSNPYHQCSEYCFQFIGEPKKLAIQDEPVKKEKIGGERAVHPDCRDSSNPYHECTEYCFKIIDEAKKLAILNQPVRKEKIGRERAVHPDCSNSSNPYHKCREHCFRIIAEAKKLAIQNQPVKKENIDGERAAHPDCRNSSNPYHECSEYRFKIIAEAKKLAIQNQPVKNEKISGESAVHPDCRNSSNPYHECSEYRFKIIAEAKKLAIQNQPVKNEKISGESAVHPDCRNSSNPYHECSEYCFKSIAEAKKLAIQNQPGGLRADGSFQPTSVVTTAQTELPVAGSDPDDHRSEDDKNVHEHQPEVDFTKNEASKANQASIVAKKKRMEPQQESSGISKRKWLEERKKKISKLLDANGLDMTKAYFVDTQQMAETKYKEWEKQPAPAGWDDMPLPDNDDEDNEVKEVDARWKKKAFAWRKARKAREHWSEEQEVALAQAWIQISECKKYGNEQKSEGFWKWVLEHYATTLGSTTQTVDSLTTKWKVMNYTMGVFNRSYIQAERAKGSGCNDLDVLKVALADFTTKTKRQFGHLKVWEVVKDHERWVEQDCFQGIAGMRAAWTSTSSKRKSTEYESGSNDNIIPDMNEDSSPPFESRKTKKKQPASSSKTVTSVADEITACIQRRNKYMESKQEKDDLAKRLMATQLEGEMFKNKQREMKFFMEPHDHILDPAMLACILEQKRALAQKHGWPCNF